MSSTKFNGFWLLAALFTPNNLCQNEENSASEKLENVGFVTKYIRVKRQLGSFLPDKLDPVNRNVQTVEFLPVADRVGGQEEENVPVVEKLPFADRVSEQEGKLSAADKVQDEDFPVVEQLPIADRISEQDENLPVVDKGQDEDLPLVKQWPVADRVKGQDEDLPVVDQWPVADRVRQSGQEGILPENEFPLVEQFPVAESVKQEDAFKDTHDIMKLPIADKIREYPGNDDALPELDKLPEDDRINNRQSEAEQEVSSCEVLNLDYLPPAEKVKGENNGETLYADDALVAARIPSFLIHKTDLSPERVVEGKITDNVDFKSIKQLDNWQPDEQEMKSERVQGGGVVYDDDLEASAVKEEPQPDMNGKFISIKGEKKQTETKVSKNANQQKDNEDETATNGTIDEKLDEIDNKILLLTKKFDDFESEQKDRKLSDEKYELLKKKVGLSKKLEEMPEGGLKEDFKKQLGSFSNVIGGLEKNPNGSDCTDTNKAGEKDKQNVETEEGSALDGIDTDISDTNGEEIVWYFSGK